MTETAEDILTRKGSGGPTAGSLPPEGVDGLPPQNYSDPDVLQRERAKVFAPGWHYLGHTGQLDACNRIIGQAGQTPVVVTKDKDGVLRAFLNVCRHRWHPVVETSGNGRMLQCGYHSWTYRLDGTLAGAPGTHGDSSFDKAKFGLQPVQLETIGPWIFVNAEPSADSMWSGLADCAQFVENIQRRSAGYVFTGRSEYVVKANWKLFIDNTAECYHCSSIHADSISQCFMTDRDNYDVRSYRNAWTQHGPAIEQPAELGGEPAQGLDFMMLFPSNFMGVDDVVSFCGTALPISADETRLMFDSFRNPIMSDETVERRGEMYDVTFREDLEAISKIQPSMHLAQTPISRLLPATEHQVIGYQQRLREAMQ
ncbi:aromatic ring-hydroxylating oxygenase subunit alpha [Mycobacterium kyogaense]|uniref:aromatic ring-hydroxylating oxygenase subunit alpha n=1 Tax=Mycobacterium kyogaense TaxID=2212479 RepID=UPI000DAD4469|nr:aromatic ring-hydroxylating dioxygenase subunit alpha [Mycobacterium kyogaense]